MPFHQVEPIASIQPTGTPAGVPNLWKTNNLRLGETLTYWPSFPLRNTEATLKHRGKSANKTSDWRPVCACPEHSSLAFNLLPYLPVGQPYFGDAQRNMSSCWSCLVILEQGATVCPLCGADQTRPVPVVDPHLQPPVTATRVFQEWKIVIAIVLVFALSMGGILWRSFGEAGIAPALQSAGVAAKSLRELREALSVYALSTKDTYPPNLNTVSSRVSSPLQAAVTAGYRIEYNPKSSSSETVFRGFVILARPERSGFLNLRIDESGVVRATEENRPATAQDPPL